MNRKQRPRLKNLRSLRQWPIHGGIRMESLSPCTNSTPNALNLFVTEPVPNFQASCNRHPLSGLTLLDIGCGGDSVEPMARLGFSVTGIDGVEKNVQVAQTHAARSDLHIDYRAILAEDLHKEGSSSM